MTNTEQPQHSRVVVVARADGRGGVHPFGTFGKNQKGIDVYIQGKPYKVTSDGRVNIPKSIMQQGVKGKDGRYRIEIEFSTKKGRTGDLKEVQSRVFKPSDETKNKETGYKVKKEDKPIDEKIGEVENEYEYTWYALK